ncbi:FAD-dependent oxidoreductase [Bordetella avium]|uniref:FAD-dependent oxidoreductase n=1 Tax=Bordetella avium TaxID=521 RepID=UPI000E0B960C|nr:GMC family oxidoreductase [Bordetella avium]RIQ13060.1 GMC family oxidoreductase [Bordetella avium]RIQ37625.1 GMC family oxidoreductase [Bordetella avium]RIQ42249.1 GMC family oxidoreductase [Bordetella avium]RIQ42696.1 GMC family oxidoreductase [Bordetella avium]RIQ49159.1 GMC family oxidoreductase [Bordetella avium]
MIQDANDIPNGSVLEADLCIVGGGAAGISMALALMDSGLNIVLLESGGSGEEPASQALYQGSVADTRLHSEPDRYRQRRMGGSTTIWGGRCMPFDAIDFEAREYMPHSGWPIGLDDLRPYYPEANRLCEAGDFAYTAATAFHHPLQPMIAGFDGPSFSTDTLERFSCPTDFGQRYGERLRRGPIRVLQHANLCRLDGDKAQAPVGPTHVRTLSGIAFTVRARAYVLATGGLETARLLLSSPGASGLGLGNAHDVVGRYYMCHLAGTIGSVDLSRAASVWHGYDISDEGVYCRRRLALRPSAQRRLQAGNFVARLHHPRIPDPGHGNGILSALYLARPIVPYEYARRLYGDTPASAGLWLAHLRNAIVGAPAAAGFLWHWLNRRTLAARKFPSVIVHPHNERYSLDFHAEQAPNPDSRVTLGPQTDALGMPRLHIDWRYTPEDVVTVQRALAALAQDLDRSGVGRFEYDPEQVEAEMTRYGAYGGHHIGTARMGSDPRNSVVDANCRVHETSNLYIASSAVFPTSSQANPTLTIVALALRLAGHLRRACATRHGDMQA